MLRKAIQHVIDDSSFHLPVEPAATALRQAKTILDWGTHQQNRSVFEGFEEKLVLELSAALPSSCVDARSFLTVRSDMCRSYHDVRTSPQFIALWSEFIKSATSNSQPQPTLYQELNDLIFEELVRTALPIPHNDSVTQAAPITYEDANVIRYAAGYVCRKIHDKLQTSTLPNKSQLTRCVMGLLEEEDEQTPSSASDYRVNEIDRGGLWHVQEGTYMLFSAMEEEVREHFQMGCMRDITDGCKEKIMTAIKTNNEVLFHWCMLTAESEDEHAQEVLSMLVNLWITVRGFSFASSWLEIYTRDKKRGLQRSKALRKEIK